MKIAFLGGKSWGKECLKILIDQVQKEYFNDVEIKAVFINKSEFSLPEYADPIHNLAIKNKIPIISVYDKNEFSNFIKSLEIDLILCVFYDFIVPYDVISTIKYGAINLHMGDAEKYRGCYAPLRAILNGDSEFGVTLHYMDEGIDTGAIIDKSIFEIDESQTGYELYELCKKKGLELFKKNIQQILKNKVVSRKQNDKFAKHYKRVLPKKNFTSEEIKDNADLFIKSILAFDFPSFEGLNLDINGNKYELKRKNNYEI